MKVGFMSCHEDFEFRDFNKFGFAANQSLLELDLVLWDMGWLDFGYNSTRTPDTLEPKSVYVYGDEAQRLISDRNRRLREIDWLMRAGKTLVILCPAPVKFRIEVWNSDGISTSEDITDNYSLLPVNIQKRVRNHATPAWGKRIEFRGDEAFSSFWRLIEGVAWYSVYFTSPIGTPFLYVKDTPYPVATWFTSGRGNIFLIPGTYDDSYDDYPTFVEAAKHLIVAAEILSGKHSFPLSERTEEFLEVNDVKTEHTQSDRDSLDELSLARDVKVENMEKTEATNDEVALYKERLNALSKTRRTYYRSLNQYEERAAQYGLNVPIEIVNQIGYFKEKIEQIEKEIASLPTQ